MPSNAHRHTTDQRGQHGKHSPNYRAASNRSLWIAFALISSYIFAEVIGGVIARSLALLADVGHMITDAASIGLALLALWVSARPASAKFSFGFQRVEVLAALLNALSLWIIAAWIFFEAYRRFSQPPEVDGVLTLTVGTIGLMVNVAAALVLKRTAGESLNVEGAFLHVVGDLLGSIGVVAAGILIIIFGWYIADPVFGVAIGFLILVSSTRLLWKVVHMLMQGTPSDVDIRRLCQALEQANGVAGVHDIHVWSLTSGYRVFGAHVKVNPEGLANRALLLRHLQRLVRRELGMAHVTIQLEESHDECAENHHVAHLPERPVPRPRE